jgi:hypothetical protein
MANKKDGITDLTKILVSAAKNLMTKNTIDYNI